MSNRHYWTFRDRRSFPVMIITAIPIKKVPKNPLVTVKTLSIFEMYRQNK